MKFSRTPFALGVALTRGSAEHGGADWAGPDCAEQTMQAEVSIRIVRTPSAPRATRTRFHCGDRSSISCLRFHLAGQTLEKIALSPAARSLRLHPPRRRILTGRVPIKDAELAETMGDALGAAAGARKVQGVGTELRGATSGGAGSAIHSHVVVKDRTHLEHGVRPQDEERQCRRQLEVWRQDG